MVHPPGSSRARWVPAGQAGTARSTQRASPCPGSSGPGDRELAGEETVGAGSIFEVCGWLAERLSIL